MNRKYFRKIIVGAAVAVAGVTGVATAAQAAPAQTAAFYTNNVIGTSGGYASVPGNLSYLLVNANLKDKHDGYYATLQVRPLVQFNSTGFSQWKPWVNIGTTANEANSVQFPIRTIPAVAGSTIRDAEVRICQTDGAGTVVGRCTVPVPVDGWTG